MKTSNFIIKCLLADPVIHFKDVPEKWLSLLVMLCLCNHKSDRYQTYSACRHLFCEMNIHQVHLPL